MKDWMKEEQERIFAAIGKIKADTIFRGGKFVNVFTNELEEKDIALYKGVIVGTGNYSEDGANEIIDCRGKIITPGFIDGHIHIESSMLSPKEFAATVVPHGTTAVITDPHEIANVAGTDGIDYMLASTEGLPLEVFLMLPSCVPATSLDESGAVLEADDLSKYMDNKRVLGLAELMNSYGTLQGDSVIMNKLILTKNHEKLIDGHAPGLNGNELNGYITAGVTSDHECSTTEDALEKLRRGQWIMVREGTAAKNMEALMPLFEEPYSNRSMLVTDDKHSGDLLHLGHMDYLIRKAVQRGANPLQAVKMATRNPAEYFGLKNVGAIAPGYKADLVILDDLDNVRVEAVYKAGQLVAKDNMLTVLQDKENYYFPEKSNFHKVYHSFHRQLLTPIDFRMEAKGNSIRVIELVPGELLTKELVLDKTVLDKTVLDKTVLDKTVLDKTDLDEKEDIIKLAVVERHHNTGHIGLGYLKGYGLKKGAVASSISHDSHNLIIAGTNEEDMTLAANCVIKNEGGIAVVSEGKIVGQLPLPIAGLMCEQKAEYVEHIMTSMKVEARSLGVSEGIDPFMTLAFISLPVIPEIRLTTLGLVDAVNQKKMNVFF